MTLGEHPPLPDGMRRAQLYELIVELQRRGLHVYNPDTSRLVPVDALVIVREDGNWQLPPKAWHGLNAAAAFGCPSGSVGILDALAEAAAETPQ